MATPLKKRACFRARTVECRFSLCENEKFVEKAKNLFAGLVDGQHDGPARGGQRFDGLHDVRCGVAVESRRGLPVVIVVVVVVVGVAGG